VTTVSATKRKLILQNFDFSVTELTNSTSNKVENLFEKLNVHKPVDVQCCFLKFQHHQNLQAAFNSIKNVLLHCGRCESNKLHSIFKKGQFLNMNVFDFVFRSY
jgi:hypothetical protein